MYVRLNYQATLQKQWTLMQTSTHLNGGKLALLTYLTGQLLRLMLVQPSSATPECVFSLLNATTGHQWDITTKLLHTKFPDATV